MNTKKEKRIEEILLSLRRCDYLSRDQLQKMHNLGQTRNAQRILSSLDEYVSCFVEDRKKIYYLNAAGREMVQSDKVRKKTAMVTHYLMRNDLFLHLGRPATWQNEIKITIPNSKISIVADAVFASKNTHHFVEVDYKQTMAKNAEKIKRYRQLSTINPQFALVWVTITPFRKKKLESMCEGLKGKVFVWDDIK